MPYETFLHRSFDYQLLPFSTIVIDREPFRSLTRYVLSSSTSSSVVYVDTKHEPHDDRLLSGPPALSKRDVVDEADSHPSCIKKTSDVGYTSSSPHVHTSPAAGGHDTGLAERSTAPKPYSTPSRLVLLHDKASNNVHGTCLAALGSADNGVAAVTAASSSSLSSSSSLITASSQSLALPPIHNHSNASRNGHHSKAVQANNHPSCSVTSACKEVTKKHSNRINSRSNSRSSSDNSTGSNCCCSSKNNCTEASVAAVASAPSDTDMRDGTRVRAKPSLRASTPGHNVRECHTVSSAPVARKHTMDDSSHDKNINNNVLHGSGVDHPTRVRNDTIGSSSSNSSNPHDIHSHRSGSEGHSYSSTGRTSQISNSHGSSTPDEVTRFDADAESGSALASVPCANHTPSSSAANMMRHMTSKVAHWWHNRAQQQRFSQQGECCYSNNDESNDTICGVVDGTLDKECKNGLMTRRKKEGCFSWFGPSVCAIDVALHSYGRSEFYRNHSFRLTAALYTALAWNEERRPLSLLAFCPTTPMQSLTQQMTTGMPDAQPSDGSSRANVRTRTVRTSEIVQLEWFWGRLDWSGVLNLRLLPPLLHDEGNSSSASSSSSSSRSAGLWARARVPVCEYVMHTPWTEWSLQRDEYVTRWTGFLTLYQSRPAAVAILANPTATPAASSSFSSTPGAVNLAMHATGNEAEAGGSVLGEGSARGRQDGVSAQLSGVDEDGCTPCLTSGGGSIDEDNHDSTNSNGTSTCVCTSDNKGTNVMHGSVDDTNHNSRASNGARVSTGVLVRSDEAYPSVVDDDDAQTNRQSANELQSCNESEIGPRRRSSIHSWTMGTATRHDHATTQTPDAANQTAGEHSVRTATFSSSFVPSLSESAASIGVGAKANENEEAGPDALRSGESLLLSPDGKEADHKQQQQQHPSQLSLARPNKNEEVCTVEKDCERLLLLPPSTVFSAPSLSPAQPRNEAAATTAILRRPWWRLRLLRIAGSVVAKNDFNSGVNLYSGLSGELGNGLGFSAHMDVLRRLSCAITSSRGALDLAVRLRVNLITFHQTALDVGVCYRPWHVRLPRTELRLAASQRGQHSVSVYIPDCTREVCGAWLHKRRRDRVVAAEMMTKLGDSAWNGMDGKDFMYDSDAAEGHAELPKMSRIHGNTDEAAAGAQGVNRSISWGGVFPTSAAASASDSGHWISFASTLEALGQAYDSVYHAAQQTVGAYMPAWRGMHDGNGSHCDEKEGGDVMTSVLGGAASNKNGVMGDSSSATKSNAAVAPGEASAQRNLISSTLDDTSSHGNIDSKQRNGRTYADSSATMRLVDSTSWRSRLRVAPYRTHGRMQKAHRQIRGLTHRVWSRVYSLDWLESALDSAAVDVTVGLTSSKSAQRCRAYSAYVILSAR